MTKPFRFEGNCVKALLFYFCFAGVDASSTLIASYTGSHDGFIELPNTYNTFTQPPASTFQTKVSSGPRMFLDFLTDGSDTAEGVKVYVNLLLESMFINTIYDIFQEIQIVYIEV